MTWEIWFITTCIVFNVFYSLSSAEKHVFIEMTNKNIQRCNMLFNLHIKYFNISLPKSNEMLFKRYLKRFYIFDHLKMSTFKLLSVSMSVVLEVHVCLWNEYGNDVVSCSWKWLNWGLNEGRKEGFVFLLWSKYRTPWCLWHLIKTV